MKLTKRIVALVLCAMMIVTALPLSVFATTAEDPASVLSTDESETSNYKPFHMHLDFEGMGTSTLSDYVTANLKSVGASYAGNNTPVVVTENDNTYISIQTKDYQKGFTIVAPDLFADQTFEIRFDTRLSYNENSGTDALFFPLVRFSPSTSTSGGTANALVIKTPASAGRENGKLMGQLRYTTGTGTAGESVLGAGYNLYADTWYSFRLVYDASTTKGSIYMAEAGGAEKYLGDIDCFALNPLDRILFGRGYSSTFVNMAIDNLKIMAVDPAAVGVDTETDFEALAGNSAIYVDSTGAVVDSTTEGAVNPVTDATFNATSGLTLAVSGGNIGSDSASNFYYYVGEEENGNTYLAKRNATSSFNLYDANDLLKNGKFEISFDLLPITATNNGGILSLKDVNGATSGNAGEARILSVQTISDVKYLVFGKSTTFPLCELVPGEWIRISITVDPRTSDYEVWINGELKIYTRIDQTKTTADTIVHKIHSGNAWSSTTVASTNSNYPFRATLADCVKYLYFFHAYDSETGIDNLRIRTFETVDTYVAKRDGDLYAPALCCPEALMDVSPAGLRGVSVSPVPTIAGGKVVNTKAGSSRMELALSTDSYTYLEDGVLCIEGKITPEAFSGNSGEFVFASLNRYTSASNGVSAKLVTISAAGKVSVGTKANVATLTAGKTYTLKVYVDTETMLATLFVDGVRKAINVSLENDLLLAPVVDNRDVLVPAIGADGCVVADIGNSAATVPDYLRFDFGIKEAVLDTVVLFDSTVGADTWGFTAQDLKISYTTSTENADIDFDFASDITDETFTSTDATVANGALTIAENGSLVWDDANLDMVDWLADRGFVVELKIKADATGAKKSLVQIVSGTTHKDVLAIDGEGRILAGGTEGKYPLASASSDTYTAVQLVFTAGTTLAGVYADGKLLGNVNYELGYMGINKGGLCFLGDAILDELKIHGTLVRDYAKETGNIFDWDMEYYTPCVGNVSPGASNGSAPTDGYIAPGTLTTLITPTAENGETRSFLRRTGTGSGQSEVFATGHLADSVTVLEATLRNTVPGTSSSATDIFRIRKGTLQKDSNFLYLLHMNNGTGEFYFKSNGVTYYLCDEEGTVFTANSETDWTSVAVVYDAVSATLRYTVNGRLAYAKKSGGSVLGFADGYAVNELNWNSLVAEETRVRLYVNSGAGTLDVANYRAYEIDPTATAEIVGSQVSALGDAIRVIAGVDMLHYGSIGFKAEYFDKNGKQVGNAQIVDDYKVYYTVNGGGETYSAEDLGYRYLAMVVIEGIETTEGSYRITPFTTLGGLADANATVYYGTPYTMVMDDQEETGIRHLSTTTAISEAVYDTSEVVQYRGDALSFNGIDAVFTFSANCEGDVSINLANARQVASVNASTFELWVDGVKQDDLVLNIGHHNVMLAEDLESGEHTFKLVKKTGGDYVHIYSVTLDGTFTNTATAGRKNGVMLEVSAPTPGMEYGNFYVYTQTSDPTGKYYIKYNFMYEKDDSYLYALAAKKGNTGYNRKNYRIREAFLMEYDETAGTFTKIWQVLHQGEISVAIKESGSADFIGGYHGDERLELVNLFADGMEIDLTKASSLTSYSKLLFNQTSVLNTSDKPFQNVLRHIQNYVIDSSGIRNHQQLEILSNNFKPLSSEQVYMQMFTYYRTNTINGETVLLHDTVNLLDATGKPVTLTADEISSGKLNTFKASDYFTAGTDKSVKGSVNSRYMEYIGADDNGLYGKVGFNITDHSIKVSSVSCNIRRYNDVKWYPSVIGRTSSPVKGETWSMDLYYTIDYVNPESVKVEDPVEPPVVEGETPDADVASAVGSAAVVLDTAVDYDGDSSSYLVACSSKTGGIALKQIEGLSNLEVGKTYEISAYVYANADVDTSAFRMAVADGEFNVAKSSYQFAVIGKAWNKMTMLYTVTDADHSVVMIDQDTSGALLPVSSALCTSFYIDAVSAKEYVDAAETEYSVYKYEDYESAPQTFGKYNYPFTNYDVLTSDDTLYTTGGNFTGLSRVGALNWNSHSGAKALTLYDPNPNANGDLSGRIKLSNLLPDDIRNYVGYTFKISAYVMMDDLSAGESKKVSTRFGVMGDKVATQMSYSDVSLSEGAWTYVEHEFTLSQSHLDTLTVIDQDENGEARYYPLRVYLNFGGASNYPGVIYIDDLTVEMKAPAAE